MVNQPFRKNGNGVPRVQTAERRDPNVLLGTHFPFWGCSKCGEDRNFACRIACQICGAKAPQATIQRARQNEQAVKKQLANGGTRSPTNNSQNGGRRNTAIANTDISGSPTQRTQAQAQRRRILELEKQLADAQNTKDKDTNEAAENNTTAEDKTISALQAAIQAIPVDVEGTKDAREALRKQLDAAKSERAQKQPPHVQRQTLVFQRKNHNDALQKVLKQIAATDTEIDETEKLLDTLRKTADDQRQRRTTLEQKLHVVDAEIHHLSDELNTAHDDKEDEERHKDLPEDVRANLIAAEKAAHAARRARIAAEQERAAADKKPDGDAMDTEEAKGEARGARTDGTGSAARGPGHARSLWPGGGPNTQPPPCASVEIPDDDDELDATATEAGINFDDLGASDPAAKRAALATYNHMAKKQRCV